MEELNSDIVKLNVGGTVFVCRLATLASRGENRLTKVVEDGTGTEFLDRNPKTFHHVLCYLRTGHVYARGHHREMFYDELEFWNIPTPPKKWIYWDWRTASSLMLLLTFMVIAANMYVLQNRCRRRRME